jgi:hypothetical protein
VLTVFPGIDELWPPNQMMVADPITGSMLDSLSGIDPGSATFRVVDEYGAVQPTGPIAVRSDGTYSFTVALQSSRTDEDVDGRHYQIVVSATDRSGNRATAAAIVTVPHDRRGER